MFSESHGDTEFDETCHSALIEFPEILTAQTPDSSTPCSNINSLHKSETEVSIRVALNSSNNFEIHHKEITVKDALQVYKHYNEEESSLADIAYDDCRA